MTDETDVEFLLRLKEYASYEEYPGSAEDYDRLHGIAARMEALEHYVSISDVIDWIDQTDCPSCGQSSGEPCEHTDTLLALIQQMRERLVP